MKRADLMNYCLSRKAAICEQPFGPDVDVIKVMGKVFALIPVVSDPPQISLKCDPVFAQVLRDTYPAVKPGWHLNKKHWNSIVIDGTVADDEIKEWIDHSYAQVVKGLTRAQKKLLEKA
jgi:predicted DNA-binding protein (MmcQ/YjbR family)